MAGKKGGAAGENSKKAQGQARKAEAAASKQAAKNQQAEKKEAEEWNKGAKSNAKAEAAAEKAAEAARKKAEKEALLREEEASLPSKPKGKAPKAEKKTRGIDSALGSFDTKPSAINASGIDNALDALDITGGNQEKLDRHPERRFKAAYAAFEERRLEEMKDEKGLRRQQKIDQIRKEFEKHPENPFNQVSATYNASKEEIAALKESEKEKKERRLAAGLN
ncbi:Nn.00g046920.m01.CDS01 [Neocucurbitaria sp. VM-36]